MSSDTYKIKPWAHQLEAIERGKELKNFAIFFDVGCGKTSTAINLFRHKCVSKGRLLRTLIFAPPIVVPNWINEFALHSNLNSRYIWQLRGSGKKRLKLFSKNAFDKDEKLLPGVWVTNYESLLMGPLFDLFKRWEPEHIIYDEAHLTKDHRAKRSRKAYELAQPWVKRLRGKAYDTEVTLLTGTPVLNSPMDLFQPFKIMDDGVTLGEAFFTFRSRYFADRNAWMRNSSQRYFPKWEVKTLAKDRFDAMAEISEKISPVSIRKTKAEALDLPDLVKETYHVGMTPDQRRLYKEMKNDFITFMDSKAVVAQIALTKALRLMQITSGFITTDENETISLNPTPKLDALGELLKELTPGHKVIVWAVWKNNYKQITDLCDKLGIPCVQVHGEISSAGKQEAVERFNTDPKVRVFLGHPGAGGIGINLVPASYSIFYSRTFSLEHSLQAEGRNHRGGSEIHKKITRIDLVCENTIDGLVQEKLNGKLAIGEKILKDLAAEMKESK